MWATDKVSEREHKGLGNQIHSALRHRAKVESVYKYA